MARSFRRAVLLAVLAAGCAAAPADGAELVTIPTARGVTQGFILIKPERPLASVILFAGGPGALGLKSESSMKWGAGNFLVRSRDKFADHNLMVAVVDAPSDQQQGMTDAFRMGNRHAADIGAVAAYLKSQAALPVWLVGTSMGTLSAANGAIVASGIGGLVLTSTITRAPRDWVTAKEHPDGVASMALGKIAVPTLIMSHRDDACVASPAAGAPKLRARLGKARTVEIALLDGGSPPKSEPCEAFAAHGYFGIEAQAVDTIAKFVIDNSK
jgi:pimeloyl-ACP methyl ester carboxylesterase